jgi:DNA polymerase
MELLDPKVIVTLGRHSLQRFYPEGRISKDHGKILWWNDRILFPLFHPAAGLRNPAVKRNLQEDVLRLPDALRESLRRPSGRISSETSAEALGPPQPGPAAPGPVDTPAWRAEGARAGADRGGPEPDTQLSEPQIENETSEEEQGDRQLGLL